MLTITFTGNLQELQAQALQFLGLTQAQYMAALSKPTAPVIPSQVGMPALPANAPHGAYWVPSVGAPSLRDSSGNVLAVDWTKSPPVVVPLPEPTPNIGGSMDGETFLKIQTGNT